jgi:hypothetical protein
VFLPAIQFSIDARRLRMPPGARLTVDTIGRSCAVGRHPHCASSFDYVCVINPYSLVFLRHGNFDLNVPLLRRPVTPTTIK